MQRRYVKAVYEWREDDERWTFTFDLLIESGKIVPGVPYLGHSGNPNNIFYPFLLKTDGTLDFGSDYDDRNERYIETNIMNKDVQVGELVSMREWEAESRRHQEYVYKCIKVHPILIGAE